MLEKKTDSAFRELEGTQICQVEDQQQVKENTLSCICIVLLSCHWYALSNNLEFSKAWLSSFVDEKVRFKVIKWWWWQLFLLIVYFYSGIYSTDTYLVPIMCQTWLYALEIEELTKKTEICLHGAYILVEESRKYME